RTRKGSPWRDLPKEFGSYNSVFKKYNRWCKNDKLMKIFKLISSNVDMEWVFINGSHVRAHQHSTGIKDQDISKSIAGNSSKIHLTVDADGNTSEINSFDESIHDVEIAPKLIQRLDCSDTEVCSEDQGDDSKSLREQLSPKKTKASI